MQILLTHIIDFSLIIDKRLEPAGISHRIRVSSFIQNSVPEKTTGKLSDCAELVRFRGLLGLDTTPQPGRHPGVRLKFQRTSRGVGIGRGQLQK